MLWVERGGDGEPTYLLLHGLGATGAVWYGVCRAIERARLGRWIVVDLPGHGGSAPLDRYSVGALATTIASVVAGPAAPVLLGHSLGVYVGLALASGWFGVRIAAVAGIGPKIRWTDAELAAMAELAAKPVRSFALEADAWARYRKLSGLTDDIAPGPAALARGVIGAEGVWRLATDPRTAQVAGAPFDTLARSARCPVLLGRGELDPMVTLADLREYCPPAFDVAGVGHNAHVEAPNALVRHLTSLVVPPERALP